MVGYPKAFNNLFNPVISPSVSVTVNQNPSFLTHRENRCQNKKGEIGRQIELILDESCLFDPHFATKICRFLSSRLFFPIFLTQN
jgi:hypothetical protein